MCRTDVKLNISAIIPRIKEDYICTALHNSNVLCISITHVNKILIIINKVLV